MELLTIFGIVSTALFAAAGLRYVIKKDRMDVADAKARELADAEKRGYDRGVTDTRLAFLLESRDRQGREGQS